MEFNRQRGTRDLLFEDMEERKYVEHYLYILFTYKHSYSNYMYNAIIKHHNKSTKN